MPAPRAYCPTAVVARGLALEMHNQPVTARSLHQALGGKGDPATAFAAWESFVEHRDRLVGSSQRRVPSSRA